MFSNFKYDLQIVLNWFKINYMKANSVKFQSLLRRVENIAHLDLNFTGKITLCLREGKLLGITIDN